jgi:hypothetical protein
MKVKDQIVTNMQVQRGKLERKIRELETMLRIPRHHYKYLEDHGVLEEFVNAKANLNDSQAARQALDKALELGGQNQTNRFKVESLRGQIGGLHSQSSPRGAG